MRSSTELFLCHFLLRFTGKRSVFVCTFLWWIFFALLRWGAFRSIVRQGFFLALRRGSWGASVRSVRRVSTVDSNAQVFSVRPFTVVSLCSHSQGFFKSAFSVRSFAGALSVSSIAFSFFRELVRRSFSRELFC